MHNRFYKIMSSKQKTLTAPISFLGKGLHTGVHVTMTVHPAEAGYGIKFKRTDLAEQPEIEALADFVVDTSRGTTLEKRGVRISTIEHIMAALWGCGVDNARIDIDAAETPIMDGSAQEYVNAIAQTGLQELNAEREYYNIDEKILFSVPERGVELAVYPDEQFSLNVNVDFNSKIIGNQYARLDCLEKFAEDIAPCRTFVFLHELEPLISNNLIKGGDLDNAIVIVENQISDDELTRLSNLFHKQDVQVKEGYLNNLQLRFPNEPSRHKLLDMIGDLALIGMRIRGRIVAYRPGHAANVELAKCIRKNIKRDASRPRFKITADTTPVYDINQIKNLLPHRPPFLLVDKVMHLDSNNVVGIKNVTMNEPFFVGHFPSEPVMPGVLILEAMAQCGGILALSDVPDPENYSTYFMKIDGVKFRGKVVPGDTLQFELRLTEPIRRGIVIMEAKAYVGNRFVTEAILMAQISRTKPTAN